VTARRWAVRGVGQEGYARRVRSRDTAGADRFKGFFDRPGATSHFERGPALSRGRVDSARPQRDRGEPEAPCAGVQGRVREVRV
jgi:hypothetical protein